MYIFLLPATWCGLSFASGIKIRMSEEGAKELRHLSTFICFSHLFVSGLLFNVITDFLPDWSLADSYTGFVIMPVTTFALSFWIVKRERKDEKIGKCLEKWR